jgi:hypothetical protein
LAHFSSVFRTSLFPVSLFTLALTAGFLVAQKPPAKIIVHPTPTPTPTPFVGPTPLKKNGPVNQTLSPTAFVTDSKQSIKKGSEFFFTGDPMVPVPPSNALFAGYLHDTNGKGTDGNSYEARNEFYRAGLRFEIARPFGRTLQRAVLNLRIYKTHVRGTHSNPDYNNATALCAVKAVSAKSRWYGNSITGLVDIGDPSVAIAPNGGQDLHIDITPLAIAWASHPETNFGLILMGQDENLKAYTETICQTQFVHAGDGAPTLTVTF